MLTLDLGQLERRHQLSIDEFVPPDDPAWIGAEATLVEPLHVRLVAQLAGSDVVVRGRVEGRASMPCRRCLEDVTFDVAEEVTFLFRPGLDPVAAEAEEAYPLPEKGRDLDLGPALREHVLLALPRFVECSETCKGLCPACGTNLNETTCDCSEVEIDPRWAALKRLGSE